MEESPEQQATSPHLTCPAVLRVVVKTVLALGGGCPREDAEWPSGPPQPEPRTDFGKILLAARKSQGPWAQAVGKLWEEQPQLLCPHLASAPW